MLGVRSRFLTLVIQKNPKVIGTHCVIHREPLAARTTSQPLKQALDSAVQSCQLYKSECSEYQTLSKIIPRYGCWIWFSVVSHFCALALKKGNILILLACLLPQVIEFLKIQHKQELKTNISNVMFQNRLAFLADICSHLNELNRKLQDVGANTLGLRDKIAVFIAKLKLWKTKIQSGRE